MVSRPTANLIGRKIITQSALQVYELLKNVILNLEKDKVYTRLILTIFEKERQKEEVAPFTLTALPLHTCLVAGGNADDAIPVAAAWFSLHLAAQFLDDVEDGSDVVLDGRLIPPPVAVNLGTGFIAIANIALLECNIDATLCAFLGAEFNRTILQMAIGQHADITRRSQMNMEAYRQVMAAKSGNFFLLGSWAGARLATENEALLSQFESFGYNLGMMLQLNDDLKDFRQGGEKGDIASGQYTFPVVYALSVASPLERKRLQGLLSRASEDEGAEKEARTLVRMLGGEVYLLAEMLRYRRRAMAALDAIGLEGEDREMLERYVEQLSFNTKGIPKTD